MARIPGFSQKLVWMDVTNEDDARAIIRFESGAIADFQVSSIAMVGKPRWRILGTRGAIVEGDKRLNVSTLVDGFRVEIKVPFLKDTWWDFYRNVSDHLNRGGQLTVKAEEGRRVVAVMETAERSMKKGSTIRRPPTNEPCGSTA